MTEENKNIDLYVTVTATETLSWPGLVLTKDKPEKINKALIERLKADKEHAFNSYVKLGIIKVG